MSKEKLEEYMRAREIEAEAVKALHDAMASGVKDNEILMQLTEKMESTHDESMRIYAELQQFRLDQ